MFSKFLNLFLALNHSLFFGFKAWSVTSITPIGEMGGETLAIIKLNPDSATATIAVASESGYENIGEVIPLATNFVEDIAAGCTMAQSYQNSSTVTSLDVKLWEQDGTAATAFKDLEVLAILRGNNY